MKPRPTPARDRARRVLTKLHRNARRYYWSPERVRTELRRRRCACVKVWRMTIREVFGATPRELTDLRQMPLF